MAKTVHESRVREPERRNRGGLLEKVEGRAHLQMDYMKEFVFICFVNITLRVVWVTVVMGTEGMQADYSRLLKESDGLIMERKISGLTGEILR